MSSLSSYTTPFSGENSTTSHDAFGHSCAGTEFPIYSSTNPAPPRAYNPPYSMSLNYPKSSQRSITSYRPPMDPLPAAQPHYYPSEQPQHPAVHDNSRLYREDYDACTEFPPQSPPCFNIVQNDDIRYSHIHNPSSAVPRENSQQLYQYANHHAIPNGTDIVPSQTSTYTHSIQVIGDVEAIVPEALSRSLLLHHQESTWTDKASDHSTEDLDDDLWDATNSSPRDSEVIAQHRDASSQSPVQLPPTFRQDGRTNSGKKSKPQTAKRASKMHPCNVCQKLFPRPSGLATHMNSHKGLRPFPCPVETCNKKFAVRSNAKRHLRTHGINPTPESSHRNPHYCVGFDTPLVSEVPEAGRLPGMLKWVPQSLTSRTNIPWPKSTDSESDGDDAFSPLSVPLSPTGTPCWESGYMEKNPFDHDQQQPYHPRDWRGSLPGPGYS